MQLVPWLAWLTLASCSLMEEFESISNDFLVTRDEKNIQLPEDLGADEASGCICRASRGRAAIVCFGNYECRRFPQLKIKSKILRVRTSVIMKITKKDLQGYTYLEKLEIDSNHKLKLLETGLFENFVNLQELSISYNTELHVISENTFKGLLNLRNLSLVNNGFTNILHLTSAFRPSILPSLRVLDLSENPIEILPDHAFKAMEGTPLNTLDMHLCRLELVSPNTFQPLKKLKELKIGENDLSPGLITTFLSRMINNTINLNYLDISSMGFRKRPPKKLLNIISNTTIKRLNLAKNQFEIIDNDSFPPMPNLEILDIRKVSAIDVSTNAFDPANFPKLKVLLLGGNNLPGVHHKHLSDQLMILDMSNNKGNPANPLYFEIDRNTFMQTRQLKVLNLSYNRIRAIYDYTFIGLDKLRILDMENGTIYYIGNGTFRPTKRLEMLNLSNNPLIVTQNLSSNQFEGLNNLKILIMKNCGIKYFHDDDNIFEMMPNLTHLILRNNQLFYITPEILKPLKSLQVLDLSENLLISWWRPLFLASAVLPRKLYLTNNKISQFSISMIQDIHYVLEHGQNNSVEIDLMNNVFVCDCNTMYQIYLWLENNGSEILKEYFSESKFQCSSPDLWEDRRVAEYLSSIKTLNCLMYEKITSAMLIIWTVPSFIVITFMIATATLTYRFRIYIKYWIFLAKIAIGRRFINKSENTESLGMNGYKYDAFVSYCNDDSEFVAEMIAQLETSPPYLKLCVYERDFEIGSFISESVMNSINMSKFVVLIISNNFAKSQWCRWETQLAEYHRLFLEDGTVYDPLILVRIGEVENKYLTTTLKYLMKTKIYHSWNENDQEMFWKKLRTAITKSK